MSAPFLGEIRLFPYTFAPRGWAFCHGQLLGIAQNTALFSLLGTTYGGNGSTNFALPDLRGRVPISSGQGPGLPVYSLGELAGTATHTLLTTELPAHTHPATLGGTTGDATESAPTNATFAAGGAYSTAPSTVSMRAPTIGFAGGSQPHNNMPPFLALNFCIALQGIFPSRN